MARILVVDDEPTTFEAIKVTLEGHELLWAKEEHEAQESIARTPPDLIILDYLLGRTPSIPGFLLALRERLPGVPILVLTGYGTEEVAVQSLRVGASDYIKKPFDVPDLRCRIEFCLSLPQPEPCPPLPLHLIASSQFTALTNTHPALRRAVEAWTASGHTRLSLDSLAEAARVSKRQLVRLFRDATGMPPRRFFEFLKVREAAGLLGSSSLPLSEMSAKLGFSGQSHFSHVFRKYAGVTPRTFRRSCK